MMTTRRRKLTQPFETVAWLFGGLLLLVAVDGALTSALNGGSFSFGGFGLKFICATQPRTGYSGDNWTLPAGIHARPGASLIINGTLQVCASHPGTGLRLLDTLTSLPGMLVWASVLILLWRLVRAARRDGPFTMPVATAMRRLGWVIIVGSVAAGAIQGYALDALLNTMLVAQNDYGDVPNGAVQALLPTSLLVGAALLTFARITRLGVAMDDEMKATV